MAKIKKKPKVLEEVIRGEVRRAVLDLGFDVFHPADSGFTIDPRPDLLIYGTDIAIECKICTPAQRDSPTFNVGNIRWNQRRWLETWVEFRKRSGWLALGTATTGNPFFPTRTIWVIEWHEWVSFEINMMKKLATPPLTPFSVNATWINEVFWDRRLIGSPSKGYVFPSAHPFTKLSGGGLPDWRSFKGFTCPMWEDETTPEKERKVVNAPIS